MQAEGCATGACLSQFSQNLRLFSRIPHQSFIKFLFPLCIRFICESVPRSDVESVFPLLSLRIPGQHFDSLPRFQLLIICQNPLQFENLIAQGGGFLELQVFGGFLHLLFHLLHQPL
jgi:hypothetical protein